MFKKTLALLLCSILTLGALAACGDDAPAGALPVQTQSANQATTQSAPADDPTTVPTGETEQTEPPTEPIDTGMGNASTQIGTGIEYMNTVRVQVSDRGANGVIYRGDNDKYGILSRDGSHDTGAIYDAASVEKAYFEVRMEAIGEPGELDKINSVGLVDNTGKELIPAKYAVIKELNERFYQVIAVTELTEAEEYLVYLSKGYFSLSAGEDDPRYLGTWSVYDLQTGSEVPGVTGTKPVSISIYGDIVSYTVDGDRRYVNAAGQELPPEASYYGNGTYTVRKDDSVYDSNGNTVFTLEADGYEISNWDDRYYRCHKYENGTTTYALMDETGKICSGVYPKTPYVEDGDIVSCDDKLYDMQGNCIFEKELYSVYYFDGWWLIRDGEKNVYLMDSNYNVESICQLDDDYVYTLNTSDFAVSYRPDNEPFYYSVSQKTFVPGYPIAKSISERDAADYKKDLINTMTDEVLLTGYSSYAAVETEEGVYIYANAGNNVHDVFYFAY